MAGPPSGSRLPAVSRELDPPRIVGALRATSASSAHPPSRNTNTMSTGSVISGLTTRTPARAGVCEAAAQIVEHGGRSRSIMAPAAVRSPVRRLPAQLRVHGAPTAEWRCTSATLAASASLSSGRVSLTKLSLTSPNRSARRLVSLCALTPTVDTMVDSRRHR